MDLVLESELEALGLVATRLSRKEEGEWLRQWNAIYFYPVYRRTGRLDGGGSLRWETFMGYAKAVEGEAALAMAAARLPSDLVIVRLDGPGGAYLTQSVPSLDLRAHGQDVLAFPEDLSWTLAFTHEKLYGPYYSEAAWCIDMVPP